MRARWPTRLVVTASAVLSVDSPSLRSQTAAPNLSPTFASFVDAIALDDAGRAVANLGPEDLRVMIDGEPRAVVSLRYVFRGTGSARRTAPTGFPSGTCSR
jgi:hypothetical protein